MIHIEDTELEIASLVCSDDFERRLGEKHVAELAESIRDIGLINKPWVRASDMKVICGEDRIAAHCMLGKDFVEVRVVECTDAEFEKVRIAENRHRRSPEQVKELVEAIEGRLSVMESIDRDHPADEEMESLGIEVEGPARRPGRPKTIHGTAVEEAAKQLGTTPNAVRKKLARAVEAEKNAPPFETWGREAPEKIVKEARRAYEALTSAYSKITSAMSIITDMQKANVLSDSVANDIWQNLQSAAEFAKNMRPEALCPWCKGDKKLAKKCGYCLATGAVNAYKANQAPANLKEHPAAVVTMEKPVTVMAAEARIVEIRPVDEELGF